MASNSSVGSMICVVWKTQVPQQLHDKSSKSFKLMSSECVLRISKDAGSYDSLSLNMLKGSIPCLEVTTFYRYQNSNWTWASCKKTIAGTYENTILSNSLVESSVEILFLFRLAVSSLADDIGNETIRILTDSPSPTGLTTLSADLSNLLKDKVSPDVTLKCGDCTMPAHRIVLEARSTVFAAMFRNKMAESEAGVVDISDMEPQIFELFLKYVYSGTIQDLNKDTVSSLYSTGDKYAVSSLQMECSAWILHQLTRENCLDFLVLADAHSDQVLKDELVKFIVTNVEVLKGEAWSEIMEDHPKLAVYVYHKCFVTETVVKDQKKNYIRKITFNEYRAW